MKNSSGKKKSEKKNPKRPTGLGSGYLDDAARKARERKEELARIAKELNK